MRAYWEGLVIRIIMEAIRIPVVQAEVMQRRDTGMNIIMIIN